MSLPYFSNSTGSFVSNSRFSPNIELTPPSNSMTWWKLVCLVVYMTQLPRIGSHNNIHLYAREARWPPEYVKQGSRLCQRDALPSIFNLITQSAFGVSNQQESCSWALNPTKKKNSSFRRRPEWIECVVVEHPRLCPRAMVLDVKPLRPLQGVDSTFNKVLVVITGNQLHVKNHLVTWHFFRGAR